MPSTTDYPTALSTTTATIASSTTTSSAIDLGGTTLAGIQLPASFTGTSITFQAATTLGGTYQTVITSGGSTVSVAVTAGRFVTLSPSDFAGIQFLKLVSSASEAATRTIELVTRPV